MVETWKNSGRLSFSGAREDALVRARGVPLVGCRSGHGSQGEFGCQPLDQVPFVCLGAQPIHLLVQVGKPTTQSRGLHARQHTYLTPVSRHALSSCSATLVSWVGRHYVFSTAHLGLKLKSSPPPAAVEHPSFGAAGTSSFPADRYLLPPSSSQSARSYRDKAKKHFYATALVTSNTLPASNLSTQTESRSSIDSEAKIPLQLRANVRNRERAETSCETSIFCPSGRETKTTLPARPVSPSRAFRDRHRNGHCAPLLFPVLQQSKVCRRSELPLVVTRPR